MAPGSGAYVLSGYGEGEHAPLLSWRSLLVLPLSGERSGRKMYPHLPGQCPPTSLSHCTFSQPVTLHQHTLQPLILHLGMC